MSVNVLPALTFPRRIACASVVASHCCTCMYMWDTSCALLAHLLSYPSQRVETK